MRLRFSASLSVEGVERRSRHGADGVLGRGFDRPGVHGRLMAADAADVLVMGICASVDPGGSRWGSFRDYALDVDQCGELLWGL